MIGDWVMIKDYPMKAMPKQMTSEYYTRSLVEIEPIPLTPEILEKNGFRLEKFSGETMSGMWWESPEFVIREDMRDSIGKNNFKFEYVHELQHALKLCGINKEITLQ